MEEWLAIVIFGEIALLNLIYAYKSIKLFHFFPYVWLIVAFVGGWILMDVTPIIPAFFVVIGVIIFHFIAARGKMN